MSYSEDELLNRIKELELQVQREKDYGLSWKIAYEKEVNHNIRKCSDWREYLTSKVRYKELSTNNGDIRKDAEWRDGWNSCFRILYSQV